MQRQATSINKRRKPHDKASPHANTSDFAVLSLALHSDDGNSSARCSKANPKLPDEEAPDGPRHRHPPTHPAPPAELPPGRADTSNRKLPQKYRTAARLPRSRGRRRRSGDAGCRPDPRPVAAVSHRDPGLHPGRRRQLPAASPVPGRYGGAVSARHHSAEGRGSGELLQPCPCRAAPPLPFPVPPGGSAAGEIPAPPSVPLPRGGKPGRKQPPERSSPDSPRTGSASRLPPGAPPTPPYPSAGRPHRSSSGGGRNLSHRGSSFKVLPEAGEGAREGGEAPATGPEVGRVVGPAACPPQGPSACRNNKFCAQDTMDSAFVRVYA
ncbi:basic proline-rich protein-like [Empidonax traillii]|uniref:basic proline-rich protein-like n=1 Tax=Empidonax traillii TaxID=164674 RepID=UPI000FFD98AA|nr:basic proline-rich protein-like [Empidonax traillii]